MRCQAAFTFCFKSNDETGSHLSSFPSQLNIRGCFSVPQETRPPGFSFSIRILPLRYRIFRLTEMVLRPHHKNNLWFPLMKIRRNSSKLSMILQITSPCGSRIQLRLRCLRNCSICPGHPPGYRRKALGNNRAMS